ncbi:MAG: polymerase, sigma-24 subunit, subfamily [Frankiales bacterium]|nr:polymerase, sigma-24 subunit, subfamily [Frankiales bacterium]
MLTELRATEPVSSGDPLDAALRRACAGDEDGFLALWRALQPRLLRYLRVKAGNGFEDVAAETWLQVVRDIAAFSGDAVAFRSWLFTIARHRAIDAARSRRARPLVLVDDLAVLEVRQHMGSAEDVALERASTERALAVLRSLPADQAEMVALRVLGDLDVATVAAIVGKSPGAVRVSVHRGLRALAEQPRLEPLEET